MLENQKPNKENHAELKAAHSSADLTRWEKLRNKVGAKVLGSAVKVGLGLTGVVGWFAGEAVERKAESTLNKKTKENKAKAGSHTMKTNKPSGLMSPT